MIEEVCEIEYWRETMTQTNSLRYRRGQSCFAGSIEMECGD